MSGYTDLFIAINPSNGGNYEIEAVMGTGSFANLSPVNQGGRLFGSSVLNNAGDDFSELLVDGAQALTVDVWNIFYIKDSMKDQKLLQFKMVNNSGGASTIQTAFMRLV